MKKLFCVLMCIATLSCMGNEEKIFIDINDFTSWEETFHIHEGENIWIQSNVLRSCPQGFYIFESDIMTYNGAYEKKWRCPYCNSYWPIGVACKNPDCPSKFKGI